MNDIDDVDNEDVSLFFRHLRLFLDGDSLSADVLLQYSGSKKLINSNIVNSSNSLAQDIKDTIEKNDDRFTSILPNTATDSATTTVATTTDNDITNDIATIHKSTSFDNNFSDNLIDVIVAVISSRETPTNFNILETSLLILSNLLLYKEESRSKLILLMNRLSLLEKIIFISKTTDDPTIISSCFRIFSNYIYLNLGVYLCDYASSIIEQMSMVVNNSMHSELLSQTFQFYFYIFAFNTEEDKDKDDNNDENDDNNDINGKELDNEEINSEERNNDKEKDKDANQNSNKNKINSKNNCNNNKYFSFLKELIALNWNPLAEIINVFLLDKNMIQILRGGKIDDCSGFEWLMRTIELILSYDGSIDIHIMNNTENNNNEITIKDNYQNKDELKILSSSCLDYFCSEEYSSFSDNYTEHSSDEILKEYSSIQLETEEKISVISVIYIIFSLHDNYTNKKLFGELISLFVKEKKILDKLFDYFLEMILLRQSDDMNRVGNVLYHIVDICFVSLSHPAAIPYPIIEMDTSSSSDDDKNGSRDNVNDSSNSDNTDPSFLSVTNNCIIYATTNMKNTDKYSQVLTNNTNMNNGNNNTINHKNSNINNNINNTINNTLKTNTNNTPNNNINSTNNINKNDINNDENLMNYWPISSFFSLMDVLLDRSTEIWINEEIKGVKKDRKKNNNNDKTNDRNDIHNGNYNNDNDDNKNGNAINNCNNYDNSNNANNNNSNERDESTSILFLETIQCFELIISVLQKNLIDPSNNFSNNNSNRDIKNGNNSYSSNNHNNNSNNNHNNNDHNNYNNKSSNNSNGNDVHIPISSSYMTESICKLKEANRILRGSDD